VEAAQEENQQSAAQTRLYYTLRQAATLLGLSKHIIKEAIRRNVIKSAFLDNKTIVHQNEMERFRKYRKASSAQAKQDA